MRIQLTKEGRVVLDGVLKSLPGVSKAVFGFFAVMYVLSSLRSCVCDTARPIIYQQPYHPFAQDPVASPQVQQGTPTPSPYVFASARRPGEPIEPFKTLTETYPYIFPPDQYKQPPAQTSEPQQSKPLWELYPHLFAPDPSRSQSQSRSSSSGNSFSESDTPSSVTSDPEPSTADDTLAVRQPATEPVSPPARGIPRSAGRWQGIPRTRQPDSYMRSGGSRGSF
jgi:hypothetical protein